MPSEFSNHVVLIPTQDRPRELYRTVASVFKNMKKFGRKNVKLLVFDDSTRPESFKTNCEKLRKAASRNGFDFNKHVTYFDNEKQKEFTDFLDEKVGKDERVKIIPEEKSFGRSRNFLALLGLTNGSEKTAFHWLDDDTSLHELSHFNVGVTWIRPLEKDFFETAGKALEKTGHAYGTFSGVPDLKPENVSKIFGKAVIKHFDTLVAMQKMGFGGNSLDMAKHIKAALKRLGQGEMPLHRTLLVNKQQQHPRGFNRSLSYKALKEAHFELGVSDEDLVHVMDIKNKFPAEAHDATTFHWYGHRGQAFQLPKETIEYMKRELEEVKQSKAAKILSKAIKQYEKKSEQAQPRKQYQDSLDIVFNAMLNITTWKKLVNAIEKEKTRK